MVTFKMYHFKKRLRAVQKKEKYVLLIPAQFRKYSGNDGL